MNNQEPIRLEELLAELEALGSEQEVEHPGWSAQELSDRWGVTRQRVLDVLSEAKGRGLLRVGRKRIESIDGRSAWRPSYSIRQDDD